MFTRQQVKLWLRCRLKAAFRRIMERRVYAAGLAIFQLLPHECGDPVLSERCLQAAAAPKATKILELARNDH